MTSAMPEATEQKERQLPVWAPWAIAVVVVAVAAFAVLEITDEPPVASGRLTKVFSIEQASGQRVLTGVEVEIRNTTADELLLRHVEARMKAGEEEHSDSAAAAPDYPKYFRAYPAFKQSDAPPLPFETKFAPGEQKPGLFIFTFPVSRVDFDKRSSLELRVTFYGRKPVVLAENVQQ
jgi:hypothetical protein